MAGSGVEWAFISQPLALSVLLFLSTLQNLKEGEAGTLVKKMGDYFADTGLVKFVFPKAKENKI